jgi:hypothetical protein
MKAARGTLFVALALAIVLTAQAGTAGAVRAQIPAGTAEKGLAWESFLKSAEIVDSVQLSGPDATSRPWKLTLEKDGVRRFGLWKNIDTDEFGTPDRWRCEIAAYRFDRLTGLGLIPPTVERRFNGEKGSLQLWIDDTDSLKKKTRAGETVPLERKPEWNRTAYLERAFDSLIADSDRNANNILVTADWKIVLIDHSRSFRTDKPYAEKLMFGPEGLSRAADGSPFPFLPLPRPFVERLKAIDFKTAKEAVKPYLNDREIRTALERAALIVRAVEKAAREGGESLAVYQ